MSLDYIESLFDILDGKVNFSNVGKKKRGRKAGYKHSQETIEKIADQMRNRTKTEEEKKKISQSLQGIPKSKSTRRKISRSKKGDNPVKISDDLLSAYNGAKREKDVSTSTAEWLERCGHNRVELCEWIKAHSDEFNEFGFDEFENEAGDIYTEKLLNEGFYKESPIDQDAHNEDK